jgi:hypothetical protein
MEISIDSRRVSSHFSEEELSALSEIMNIVRKGGDARIVARQPAAVRAAQKIQRMRQTIIEAGKLSSDLTKGGVS